MSAALDPEAALAFQLAFQSLFLRAAGADLRPNPRPLAFMAGEPGVETVVAEMSQRHGRDVVCLVHRPGRERDGPVNYAVCEEREGVLHLWPQCRPWTDREDGPILLLAKDEPVGFCHDGTSIVMMWNAPTRGIRDGVALARRRLRSMVDCEPGDVRLRPTDPAFQAWSPPGKPG